MAINVSTSRAVFRWRPACWLRVTGDDAARFLQGQFTNDVLAVENAPAVYGLWLTLKGKVLADSFIIRGGTANEFWIGSYFSPAAVIRERLESYVIADDVVIEDVTASWAGTCLMGDAAAASRLTDVGGGSLVFPGRRDRGRNIECVYLIEAGEPRGLVSADAVEFDEEEMTRRRIAAGIPAVPLDVGPSDLPNEAGLEEEAISYTKGCYLGQEVMARLKSMGQVRRRLWRVCGGGDVWPALPAPVFSGARQVGELRSAVRDRAGGWIGLVMITLMHTRPGMELSFSAGGASGLVLNAEP